MTSFKDVIKKSVLGRLRGNIERADEVYDEYVLQFTRPGTDGECDLIIGLDFGTSASKVVIQAPICREVRRLLSILGSSLIDLCHFFYPAYCGLIDQGFVVSLERMAPPTSGT